jgi:hypothetical protein
MGVVTSSSFAKLLWPGLNAVYGNTYKDYPEEWAKLFEKNKSDRAYEEDLGYSGLGLASVKSEGNAITYDSDRQGFTTRYNHVTYANGFIITREMYEDNQYQQVGARKAAALARSLKRTKEIIGANIFNRAFNNAYEGGDGVSLIACAATTDTSHPNVAGGSWTNGLATAADLSEAALEQACIDIWAFTDDRGLLIAAKPKMLLIHPSNTFEAKRILGSEGRYDTPNNDLNALKTMGMVPSVEVNHYLTDADAWFLLTDVPDGLKYFERRGDAFEMDNDFDTENAKFKATARYSFGWSDPRCVYGSAGA